MDRDQAKPGLIGQDGAGHFLRLVRQVAGDAWEWECDLWIINHWSHENHRIHLSDLDVVNDPAACGIPA